MVKVLKISVGCACVIFFILLGMYFYLLFIPRSENVLKDMPVVGLYRPEIIGFQPYWLVGKGKDSYAKDLSTLTYFGLTLDSDGTIKKYDNPGELEPGWSLLTNESYRAYLQKEKAAGMKLSLLVANMNEEEIATLLSNPVVSAQTMMGEIAPIMREVGFTDLNLDIESFSIASNETRAQYVSFVSEVKKELTASNLGTLTVELTPRSPVEQHFIDVAKIGMIADVVVLMAYDYHYSLSEVAGPVAPVSGGGRIWDYDVEYAIEETLRFVPKEKVILGIPLYGYEWETLSDSPGAPTIPGSWSVVSGKSALELLSQTATISSQWYGDAQEPFAVWEGETSGHFQQLFFEDKKAVDEKIALARRFSLGGVAYWALGYEYDGMIDGGAGYGREVFVRGSSPQTSIPFRVAAPKEARIGIIASQSGVVKKLERNAEGFGDMDPTETLLQGETVYVDATSSATVEFDPAVDISLDSGTEIDLVELVLPNPVVRQKSGTAVYTVTSAVPWSVRVLFGLVQIDKGSAEINVEAPRATVLVKSGTATIGYIDTDNVTHVIRLVSGQKAVLVNSTRTVRTLINF